MSIPTLPNLSEPRLSALTSGLDAIVQQNADVQRPVSCDAGRHCPVGSLGRAVAAWVA